MATAHVVGPTGATADTRQESMQTPGETVDEIFRRARSEAAV
jgi:hypothetical protein